MVELCVVGAALLCAAAMMYLWAREYISHRIARTERDFLRERYETACHELFQMQDELDHMKRPYQS